MTIKADTSRPVALIPSRILAVAASALVAVTLAGCSSGMPVNQATTTIAPSTAKPGIKGILHGGQSPVFGSEVYLFAVGTSGYKTAATSLLTSATGNPADGNGNYYVLSTAPDGGFSVTGDYTCPSPGPSLVYLVAAQGNAGSGNNASLAMTALLGDCATVSNLAATTGFFVTINEVSTVAAAYALAPFATSPRTIGTSSTNYAGIANAFSEVPNLVSTTYGSPFSATPAGNGTVPASLIDTLANVIASCVNSNGAGTSAPGGCTSLFAATGASDTFSAAVAIAQNPGSATMTALTGLSTPQAPFQPSLSSTPNDLTMPVAYTGGGIATPKSVAIDASGNAWVASATNTVTELSAATGSFLSGSSGYTSTAFDSPQAIAIDTASPANVWVVNCGGQCSGSANVSNVSTVLSTTGAVTNTFSASGSPLSLSGAYGVAIDGTNKAWVTNALGKSVATFTASGGLQSGTTGLTATYQSNPTAVAIDGSGNAWAVSPSSANLTEFLASSGTSGVQGTPFIYPFAVAIDRGGNGWVLDQSQSKVYSVSAGGTAIGVGPVSGGGLTLPNAIAFDGGNIAWITNSNGSISALNTSGSTLTPSTGLQPGPAYANSIAIDGSGSVWVTSCGAYCTGAGSDPGSVYQLIGLATPAITPLAAAVKLGTTATAP